MAKLFAKTPVSQITFEAKIIRADGTEEELGVVSYWHRNPLKRFAWWIKTHFRRTR